MAKLTNAQRKALAYIAETYDRRGAPIQAGDTRIRVDVLERLRNAGLIHSEAPFAWTFYAVSITDEGRAALRDIPARKPVSA
jgi:hypothetical protein